MTKNRHIKTWRSGQPDRVDPFRFGSAESSFPEIREDDRMRRNVGIIVRDGFQVMGLAATSVFEFANLTLGEETYVLSLISEHGGVVRSSLGLQLQTTELMDFPDTLVVVGELPPRHLSQGLRDYIASAANVSRRVAGICTGAFTLGEAGLLDGRSATTHWAYAQSLQQQFPRTRVDDDKIFISDDKIWTSAGMSAGIDLALALVEDDHGAGVAQTVARRLVIYHRRLGGQSQFSALLDLAPRTDRIHRALTYAREHLRDPLTVEDLADVANVSPRQFSRLFREETGQSPAKAIERLRLEAAKAMLEDGRHPIDTIARDSGFADRDRMRRAFLRAYGRAPQAMRRSFRSAE
jgi:transcriptional regulator GlxA family with amidase domain